MNADYRGRLSMLGQLAGAMNKLLPAAVLPSSRSRFQDHSCFQCSIVSSARAQNKLVVSREVEWNLILGNKPSLRCAKRSKKLSSTIYANSFTERVERKVASRLFGSKERDTLSSEERLDLPCKCGDPRVWWRVPSRRATKEEGEREIKEERVKIRG